jgi:hypothetical protein
VYVFVRRNTRYPLFEAFDMPDTHESCPRRDVTTSPVQALTLLNSSLALEWAKGFASRVAQVAGTNIREQVVVAYRLAYSRSPAPDEIQLALGFFRRHRALVAARDADAATLVDFCHMLINSNEFVYRN